MKTLNGDVLLIEGLQMKNSTHINLIMRCEINQLLREQKRSQLGQYEIDHLNSLITIKEIKLINLKL